MRLNIYHPHCVFPIKRKLVTLQYEHYNLPLRQGAVSLHFHNWPLNSLFKPARSRPSLNTCELRRSPLYYSGASLPCIGWETNCSTMSFAPDRDIFDCRALIVWEGARILPIFSAAYAKTPAISSQSVTRLILEHVSSQQLINFDQGVQPEARISLITPYILTL